MRTFRTLLTALDAIQGVPFAELAPAVGIALPSTPDEVKRSKQLAGDIVSAALGVAPNPRPTPDIEGLSTEIKTVPVDDDLVPLERTKLGALNYQDVVDDDWPSSKIHAKLRTTLFVAVVKYDTADPAHWFVRDGFIWLPSTDQLGQLAVDYEDIRAVVRARRGDELSSARPPKGVGQHLTAGTSGRDARDTTTYAVDGHHITAKRRAWFLRKEFTTSLLRDNLAVTARLQLPGTPEPPTLFDR